MKGTEALIPILDRVAADSKRFPYVQKKAGKLYVSDAFRALRVPVPAEMQAALHIPDGHYSWAAMKKEGSPVKVASDELPDIASYWGENRNTDSVFLVRPNYLLAMVAWDKIRFYALNGRLMASWEKFTGDLAEGPRVDHRDAFLDGRFLDAVPREAPTNIELRIPYDRGTLRLSWDEDVGPGLQDFALVEMIVCEIGGQKAAGS